MRLRTLLVATAFSAISGCAPALHRALRAGDLAGARRLVELGADVNSRHPWSGRTPLAIAAQRGDTDLVRLLVQRGARIDEGQTCSPLGLAARGGHIETMRVLLDLGADPNKVTDISTPLWSAALGPEARRAVELLLERGADLDSTIHQCGSHGGRTCLAVLKPFQSRARRAAGEARPSPGQPPAASPAEPASDVDVPGRRLPERPEDVALVIGIEKYGAGLPDAQFAERDARAVRAHLSALGVPERNIRLLTGQRATHSALAAHLEEWLPRNAKAGGRVFLYFSGHGAPDPSTGQAFLVPFDGDPDFLERTAYPLRKLYAGLEALRARRVIAVIDSCFSGAGGRSVLPQGARPLVTLAETPAPRGGRVLVFSAASAKEIASASPEQGHGLFTYYFLKGLGGAAADARGAVTAKGLFQYLRTRVQDGASLQNRTQTPTLEGAIDGASLVE